MREDFRTAFEQLRPSEQRYAMDIVAGRLDPVPGAFIKPLVRAAIAELTKAHGIAADNVMREVSALAFSNMGDYVSPELAAEMGLQDLTREQWAAVKKIKRTHRYDKDGNCIATTDEFELYDKIAPNRTLLEYMEKYAPDVMREALSGQSGLADEYSKLING